MSSRKPRLLDMYCGAGGIAMGFHQAGFDVVGVDNKPQPNYPFQFFQADALEFLASHYDSFDCFHASPPCKGFTKSHTLQDHSDSTRLLPATRDALISIGKPWDLENVPGAPLRPDYVICGCAFQLPYLRRKRIFETSWRGFTLMPPCVHVDYVVSVVGHGVGSNSAFRGYEKPYIELAREAMGIDWMTRDELSQAIPPAYGEFIGRQMLIYHPELTDC